MVDTPHYVGHVHVKARMFCEGYSDAFFYLFVGVNCCLLGSKLLFLFLVGWA